MKTFLLALFVANYILAASQVPQSLNYQAVARNSNGTVIPNTLISVEISIRDGSPNPPNVYQEIDTATTNQFGLFTVAIGTGQIQSGNFTTINWATGNKYLNVGFNQNGGNNFTDMGTTELLSVPYALYAANSGSSGSVTDYAVYSETQVNNIPPQTTLIDSTWQPRQLNTTEDSAGTSISRNGNQITLQPGKYHVSASAQWGLTLSDGTLGSENNQVYARSLLKLADISNNLYLLGQAQFQSILFINASPYFPTVENPIESFSVCLEGVITISTTTTLTLQHYIGYPKIDDSDEYQTYTTNAGIAMSLGQNEYYSRIFIQKIN